jgi:serine/threonine-protein kinase
MTPPALEHVVTSCLAKDAEERWQSAADVARELRWIAEGGSQVGAPAVAVSRRKRHERALWAAGVLLVAMAAGYGGWRAAVRSGAGSQVRRLTLALPRGTTLAGPQTNPMALSPDGSVVVYSAAGEDKKGKLFLRRLDSFEATAIPGTDGGKAPFFSPNGEWLGFFADQKLKKVSLAGGSTVTLADLAFPSGATWASDGTIYFEQSFSGGLYALPAGGGAPKQITVSGIKKDDRAHLWPDVLPGGRALLFTVWTGGSFDDARIEGLWLKTGERKVLVQGGTDARYVPTGHLVYAHGGTLFAVPFDADKMEVQGPAVPVIEGVHTGAANGDAHFSFSASGELVFEPGTFTPIERNLMWMDRTGKMEKAADEVQPYAESSTFDIWVYDLGRSTLTKVTFGADDSNPRWSPDGTRLGYASSKSGQEEIYVKRGLAPGEDQMVTHNAEAKRLDDWTRDGQALIFEQRNLDTGTDLYLVPLRGDGKPQPLVKAPLDQQDARLSPDGKWLAYVSDESGRREVFVQSMNDAGVREQISRDGGSLPRWAPSGKELLYVSQDWVIAVPMGAGPGLHPGQPMKLFLDKANWAGYDVAANGRLIVARDVEQAAGGTQINLVLRWFDELKKKAAK